MAGATPSDASHSSDWTAARFFDLLQELGPLRVISICGPSVFEALCELGPYEIAGGHLNAITRAYHWHLAVERFRHLRSFDAEHRRSGRRVLFFELRESTDAAPFLRIYVHRPPDAEFPENTEQRFAAAHAELADGVALAATEAP